jgi:hypothetical protein
VNNRIFVYIEYVKSKIITTMKKIAKIFIVALCAFFTSEATADAQLLKKLFNKAVETTTEVTADPISNGQAAGAALKSLYTQYKADGKLDMTNLNNILNLTTLSNNIKELKGMSDKSKFYKDFATGLIKGSDSLVNKSNSTSVMNGLTNLVNNVDLSALTQTTETTTKTETTSKTESTSALSSLLSGSGASSGSSTTETAGNASEIMSSVSSILNLFK